jgi:hypothetical protein
MKKIKLAVLTLIVSFSLASSPASAIPGMKVPPAAAQIALAN